MIFYIVRHAEAVDANEILPDEWRYLTDKGRKTVQALGKRLAKHGLNKALIITSPLVRAVQTAQIIADNSGCKCSLEASGLLLSNGDIEELLEYLRSRESKKIMVVGHEPHLGTLVTKLLKHSNPIQLKKGSCVVLEMDLEKPDMAARFVSYIVAGKKPLKSVKTSF